MNTVTYVLTSRYIGGVGIRAVAVFGMDVHCVRQLTSILCLIYIILLLLLRLGLSLTCLAGKNIRMKKFQRHNLGWAMRAHQDPTSVSSHVTATDETAIEKSRDILPKLGRHHPRD